MIADQSIEIIKIRFARAVFFVFKGLAIFRIPDFPISYPTRTLIKLKPLIELNNPICRNDNYHANSYKFA